jgi:hypothetical protein
MQRRSFALERVRLRVARASSLLKVRTQTIGVLPFAPLPARSAQTPFTADPPRGGGQRSERSAHRRSLRNVQLSLHGLQPGLGLSKLEPYGHFLMLALLGLALRRI